MSSQTRKHETSKIELNPDELDGVSGGKGSLVGKVTAAAERAMDDALLLTKAVLIYSTGRPV